MYMVKLWISVNVWCLSYLYLLSSNGCFCGVQVRKDMAPRLQPFI